MSVPIVFDSPSMNDVLKEGLDMITVNYSHDNNQQEYDTKTNVSLKDARHAAQHLFWPEKYYPNFDETISHIIR